MIVVGRWRFDFVADACGARYVSDAALRAEVNEYFLAQPALKKAFGGDVDKLLERGVRPIDWQGTSALAQQGQWIIRFPEAEVGKHGTLRKARETIGHANSIELFHDTYVLFNFPGETPETTRETQDFVASIGDDNGPSSGWVSSQSFFILPGTETYRRMGEYHRAYGTEIRHPAWWREIGDHNALATDVLPSDAYRYREHELRDFKQWQDAANRGRLLRQSTEVSSFMKGFYGV